MSRVRKKTRRRIATDKQSASLPIFQMPEAIIDAQRWRLNVDGLVENSLKLSIQEVVSLPSVRVRDDFTCLEGWTVKGITWKGVRVSELLALAAAKSTARCVVFGSGDYTQGMSIKRCMEPTTILAYELNDTPLRAEHGAPLRLVSRGQECFESVKWVQSMHLTHEREQGSARKIALGRITRLPQLRRSEN